MATYPSAALQLRPVQIENPIDIYSKVLTLRSMQQQQRTAQQEEEMRGLQLQQQKQAMQDQQTIMQTLQQTGGDIDKAIPQLGGKISPRAFIELQKSHLETRKTLAEISDKELATKKYQNDQLSGMLQQAQAMPDDQYMQAWPQLVQQAKSIHPELQLDPSQPVPKEQLGQFGLGLMTSEQYIAKESGRRAALKGADEHAAAVAQLPGQQAKSMQDQMAFIAQTLGPSRSQKEWAARRAFIAKKLPADIVEQIPEQFSPEAVQGVKALGLNPEKSASLPDVNQYISNWLAERNLPNTPANWANAHRAYTNETKVQPGVMRMEVLASTKPVQVVDPNNPEQVIYTSAAQAIRNGATSPQSIQFQTDKGVQRAFTTGRPAEELAAFNTAIQHADLLQQAAQAMQNGDVRALNTLRNKFKTEFGSPTITNFQSIANAYSREVTKALSAGHITDNEIREQSATIPANASPAQILGAINAYKGLMQSKVSIRRQQYEAGRQGKPNFGGQDGAVQVTDPRGKVHTFPNQAAADNFKRLAGLK